MHFLVGTKYKFFGNGGWLQNFKCKAPLSDLSFKPLFHFKGLEKDDGCFCNCAHINEPDQDFAPKNLCATFDKIDQSVQLLLQLQTHIETYFAIP